MREGERGKEKGREEVKEWEREAMRKENLDAAMQKCDL